MAKNAPIIRACLIAVAVVAWLPLLPAVMLMHVVKLAHEGRVGTNETVHSETEGTKAFAGPRRASA